MNREELDANKLGEARSSEGRSSGVGHPGGTGKYSRRAGLGPRWYYDMNEARGHAILRTSGKAEEEQASNKPAPLLQTCLVL